MRAKQLTNILLFGPIMKSRNIVSIGLVIFFFLIYVLAGGNVTWEAARVAPSSGQFGAAGAGPSSLNRETSRPDLARPDFAGDVEGAGSTPSAARVPLSDRGNVATPVPSAQPNDQLDKEFTSDAMANIRQRLQNLDRRQDVE